MNVSKRTQFIAKITLMTAFLIVGSWITIRLPIGVEGISGQTFVINLIALLLSPAEGATVIIVYLFLGAAGVPVFAAGKGGVASLFGPTGGFFAAFLVMVVVISLIRGKKYNFLRYAFCTILVGMTLEYLFGIVWFMYVTGSSLGAAFIACAAPFIPMDIVKCLLACWIAKPLQNVMTQYQDSQREMPR